MRGGAKCSFPQGSKCGSRLAPKAIISLADGLKSRLNEKSGNLFV